MRDPDPPRLEIALGLAANADVSPQQECDRIRERVEMIACSRPEFHYLLDGIPELPIRTLDGQRYVSIAIQLPSQLNLVGLSARERTTRLRQQDEALQSRVDSLANVLSNTMELIAQVARIMNTSSNSKRDLEELERRRGVDTSAIRRFLGSGRTDFTVRLGQYSFSYHGKRVRRTQRVGDVTRGSGRLVHQVDRTWKTRGFIAVVSPQITLTGVDHRAKRDLQFVNLQDWQAVVLEAARRFPFDIEVSVAERIGTTSLRELPADAKVENWSELLDQLIERLVAVRAALADH